MDDSMVHLDTLAKRGKSRDRRGAGRRVEQRLGSRGSIRRGRV
jgi:hypothetical protein